MNSQFSQVQALRLIVTERQRHNEHLAANPVELIFGPERPHPVVRLVTFAARHLRRTPAANPRQVIGKPVATPTR